MYRSYKDVAEFYIVYISEAHAADDRRPVPYAPEQGLLEPTSLGQRCSVAQKLFAEKKLTIPCLVDGMENKTADAYKAWPDRLFLVRKDGLLAVAGKRGPWGFKPALGEAETWLAEFKKTGKEPALPNVAAPAAKSKPKPKPKQKSL